MIGHIRMIVILQCHHVSHKCIRRDLKCLQQVPLLEKQKGYYNCYITQLQLDKSTCVVTPKTLEGSGSVKRGGISYLEDGVHDASKRSVVGVFRHGEDVQAPFVEVLQLLGQQLLLVGLDAEARDAAAGERRPVGDLLDPADLCHQLLLLLLLLLSRL